MSYIADCLDCDIEITEEETGVVSLYGEIIEFVYCPNCRRAYEASTGRPLAIYDSLARMYFDSNEEFLVPVNPGETLPKKLLH